MDNSTFLVVDGVLRSKIDSHGSSLGDDDLQIAEFWKWFGDSPVQKEGRPIPVFHGSPDDFESFQPASSGIFFSTDLLYAEDYAGDCGFVYRCFVNPVNVYKTTPNQIDSGEGFIASDMNGSEYDGFLVDYGNSFDIAVYSQSQIKIFSRRSAGSIVPSQRRSIAPS